MEDDRQKEPVKVVSQREQKKLDRERLVVERANAERALAHEYSLIANSLAFVDLVAKIKGFVELHTRVARDAVGAETVTNAEGVSSVAVTRLESADRLRELDKSAGIDEIL